MLLRVEPQPLLHALLATGLWSHELERVTLYFKEGLLLVIAAGGLFYASVTGQLICFLIMK